MDLPVKDITGPAVYFGSFQGKNDVLIESLNFPHPHFVPATYVQHVFQFEIYYAPPL